MNMFEHSKMKPTEHWIKMGVGRNRNVIKGELV
jgi:hypothetical protein